MQPSPVALFAPRFVRAARASNGGSSILSVAEPQIPIYHRGLYRREGEREREAAVPERLGNAIGAIAFSGPFSEGGEEGGRWGVPVPRAFACARHRVLGSTWTV